MVLRAAGEPLSYAALAQVLRRRGIGQDQVNTMHMHMTDLPDISVWLAEPGGTDTCFQDLSNGNGFVHRLLHAATGSGVWGADAAALHRQVPSTAGHAHARIQA